MTRPVVLIVANTPSDNTRTLLDAVARGAREVAADAIDIVCQTPLETDAADVRRCHAIIIGTTENFGSMSGLIKDFFERIYYALLEETQGLPYALYVRAGQDGQGTLAAVQRITTGLKWKLIQEPLLLKGKFDPEFIGDCEELGAVMAAGVEAGIY
ncbi:MAG: flavodoxin family protein [Gammaproteobacteria bacterium]|nr:flavodoxin family protein [Gammaproteobacteria bacterium]